MLFADATARYLDEQRADGRINSAKSVLAYRRTLEMHAEDALAADHDHVESADRLDVLKTMDRWAHPNTKRNRRAVLVSFYDWVVLTQLRRDNPARQTRGPRRVAAAPFIPAREEVLKLLGAARARGGQDWWAIELLAGVGIRNAELRKLKVRDLRREKFVHVPVTAGKGRRERMIPAPASVQAVAREVIATRKLDDYVIAHRQTRDVGIQDPRMHLDPTRPMSQQALMRLMQRISAAAGLGKALTPHALRHYVGHRATTLGSIYIAQAWLGHADIGTTVSHYVGIATEEETVKIRARMSEDLGWPEHPTPPETAALLA